MKFILIIGIKLMVLINLHSQVNDYGDLKRNYCSDRNNSYSIYVNIHTDSIYFEYKNQSDTIYKATNSFASRKNFYVILENCGIIYKSLASWPVNPIYFDVLPGESSIIAHSLDPFRKHLTVENRKIEFIWINNDYVVAKYLIILDDQH